MKYLALVLLVAGCARTTPPTATSSDASRAHVELAELTAGRKLLVGKCSGCHRTPLPSEHLAADWPEKLGEMAGRAGLDPDQRHLIEQYLATMAPR